MNLEEAGIENGYIPEHARVRIVNVNIDVRLKTACIGYVKRASRGADEVIFWQATLGWVEP